MQITVWTFTSDDTRGVRTRVFATQHEAYTAYVAALAITAHIQHKDPVKALTLLETEQYTDLTQFVTSVLDFIGIVDYYKVESHILEVS